jgi:hypothetical protein
VTRMTWRSWIRGCVSLWSRRRRIEPARGGSPGRGRMRSHRIRRALSAAGLDVVQVVAEPTGCLEHRDSTRRQILPPLVEVAVSSHSAGKIRSRRNSKTLDLEIATAGNTEVVRAKQRTLDQLGLHQEIEDILISLSDQYHLIRPMTGPQSRGLFLYLALDRSRANLAMADTASSASRTDCRCNPASTQWHTGQMQRKQHDRDLVISRVNALAFSGEMVSRNGRGSGPVPDLARSARAGAPRLISTSGTPRSSRTAVGWLVRS